jgi:hypothetical protein
MTRLYAPAHTTPLAFAHQFRQRALDLRHGAPMAAPSTLQHPRRPSTIQIQQQRIAAPIAHFPVYAAAE